MENTFQLIYVCQIIGLTLDHYCIRKNERNMDDTLKKYNWMIKQNTQLHLKIQQKYTYLERYRFVPIILVDTNYISSSVREESETSGDAAGKRGLRNSYLGG